jgi:biotin transport system substrate-specific component
MAAASLSRPLIFMTLPQQRGYRIAAQLFAALAGSAILALSSKFSVPFWPVPMTLQVLAVFLIGAAFGRSLALATVALYLAEGIVGLPVFAGGGGVAYLLGPTGGYLVGFLFAAYIAGWAADKGFDRQPLKLLAAMLVGEGIILGLGAAWLAILLGTEKALTFGIGPFIVTDLVKIALAVAIVSGVRGLAGHFRG